MNRNKKLLMLLAVFAVIVGAAFGANKLNPDDQETAEEEATTVVYSMESDAAEELSWTNDGETLSFIKSGDTWVYEPDSSFPLDEAAITAMLSLLTEVSSAKTIEAPDDLAQYGLEEPVCTVTVATDVVTEFIFGDETSLGGDRYLSIGDGNVYLVDSGIIDNFDYGLYDLVEKESIPAMGDVTRFELISDTENYVIEHLENSGLVYSDEYEWFMQSGDGYLVLDNELTSSLIQTVTGLAWGECVDYTAGGNLADYGLDTPVAIATVYYMETVEVETNETDEDGNAVYETQENEKIFTLEIGDYYDEGCYARISGSEMVYLIDAMICDTLLYMSYADLYPDEVLLLEEDTLSGVEITLNGMSYDVEKTITEETDDEGNVTEKTVYRIEDAEIEFEEIIDCITDMESAGYAGGVLPERSEELRVIFWRNTEEYPELEIVFYQYDSTNCLVTLNAETTVFVARDDVVDLVEQINAIVLE